MLSPVRLAASSLAIAATSALLAGNARAVSIVLSSDGVISAGTVRVDIWFEDPTRTVDLAALQFDIDLAGSGAGSLAADPRFRSSATTRSNGTSELVAFPFDLLASVIDPPGSNEVRSIHATRDTLDIDELAGWILEYPTCTAGECEAQDAGLLADRIYLGSFDMRYDGTPVYYTLPANLIFGDDGSNLPEPLPPFLIELRTGQGAQNRAIEGLAPELPSLVLIGLALAGIAGVRGVGSHQTSRA
jgi:hypothetical protein